MYRCAHKLLYSMVSAIPVMFFTARSVYAFNNPLKQDSLACFLIAILNSLIYILFPVIVLMIVYTGFLFVAAQGNESKLSEARRALLWTVVGGLVILGSVALAFAIKATVDNFLTAPGASPSC